MPNEISHVIAKNVIVIPATKNKLTTQKISEKARRVAAYARVSTNHEEQLTSYEAQISYYTNYIQNNPDWEFVKMYSDEGISGTSMRKRKGFRSMIQDALDGKIDLIITKSISRFARNTVDSLSTIRQLKENGVEIFFEKENIWTFDSKGELLITIMSSLAQEESRSISENTVWAIRKSFQDGKVYVPYKHFLGYDKGADGGLVVNPEQAEIVKFIYKRYLDGQYYNEIAAELTSIGIKTPFGLDTWRGSTIKSILQNEKYKGDALLQKKYTENYLTKHMVINRGEMPMYYVENNHEAIISPEIFQAVQDEIKRRKAEIPKYRLKTIYSNKIKCTDCGGNYGPITINKGTNEEYVVWKCNNKYRKGKPKCNTPKLTLEQIHKAFEESIGMAFNENIWVDNLDHMTVYADGTIDVKVGFN